MPTIRKIRINGIDYDFETPSGSVKYKIGQRKDLPIDAFQVEVYMRSGDSSLYIVPIEDEEGGDLYRSFEQLAAEGLTFGNLI